MPQTIKTIGLILAVIAVSLPVRVFGGIGDCGTPGGCALQYRSDTASVQINFRFDDDMVLRDYKDNNAGLSRLQSLMTEANSIDSIAIIGFASPDGSPTYNYSLAQRRAKAMQRYLYWCSPAIGSVPVSLRVEQDMISVLLEYINRDSNVPRRDKVIEVLSKKRRSIESHIANLKLISGNSYSYIKKEIFPQMRMSVSYFVYYKTPIETSPCSEDKLPETTTKKDKGIEPNSSAIEAIEKEELEEVSAESTEIVPGIISDTKNNTLTTIVNTVDASILYTHKPLFSLKTNLLFDAASLLNVEVEVPIGKRWSVAGEWIFPWWLKQNKQHCLQVLSGNIEGKYWFGNRGTMSNGLERPVMTGWYAGLYVGGGYYDLEWNKVGYQGEFFIAAGLSGGYAHTINKSGSLRMEYSLGLGYMQTQYRKYDAEQDANGNWHLYRNSNGRYTLIGPTRARISFVWMINSKTKGGSVR